MIGVAGSQASGSAAAPRARSNSIDENSCVIQEPWAVTLNVAGVQHMLAQKLAKEFVFFMATGTDAEHYRATLTDTIHDFVVALWDLSTVILIIASCHPRLKTITLDLGLIRKHFGSTKCVL